MGAYGIGNGELVAALESTVAYARRTHPPLLSRRSSRAGSTASSVPWKVYTAALLQVAGVVYQPRRRGHGPQARAPAGGAARPVLRPSSQGPQQDWPRRGGQRVGRVWWPAPFSKQLRLRQRGETIQTAFMERWDGTLRGLVAPLRRRTWCLSWSRARHRGKVLLMVRPLQLCDAHTRACAKGVHCAPQPWPYVGSDHVWSYWYLASGAYRYSSHQADGRTDGTAAMNSEIS